MKNIYFESFSEVLDDRIHDIDTIKPRYEEKLEAAEDKWVSLDSKGELTPEELATLNAYYNEWKRLKLVLETLDTAATKLYAAREAFRSLEDFGVDALKDMGLQ